MLLALALRILVSACGIGADALVDPVAEFAFDADMGVLVVPIVRGEETILCLVDTGTTGLILDTAYKPSLGTPLRTRNVKTPHGALVVEEFRLPSLRLGTSVVPELLVVCTDLTTLRQALHVEVSGIIGMSVLRRYVVQFDFDTSKVRFWGEPGAPSSVWGTAIPLRTAAGGLPSVLATAGDSPSRDFVIDTGNNRCGDLSASQFGRCLSAGSLRTRTANAVVSTVRGSKEVEQGILDRFSIGVFERRDLEFTLGDVNRIGMQCLQPFLVTFDFPHNVLYLRPRNERHDPPQPIGMHVSWLEDRLNVIRIDPASHAEAAGLREGDVIVSVQGESASLLDTASLTRLLRERQGQSIAMQVRRGQESIHVVVGPRDLSKSKRELTNEALHLRPTPAIGAQ